MTLVKTMCVKCMGKGKVKAFTAIEEFRLDDGESMTARVSSHVIDCPECNGRGYIMLEGETK